MTLTINLWKDLENVLPLDKFIYINYGHFSRELEEKSQVCFQKQNAASLFSIVIYVFPLFLRRSAFMDCRKIPVAVCTTKLITHFSLIAEKLDCDLISSVFYAPIQASLHLLIMSSRLFTALLFIAPLPKGALHLGYTWRKDVCLPVGTDNVIRSNGCVLKCVLHPHTCTHKNVSLFTLNNLQSNLL